MNFCVSIYYTEHFAHNVNSYSYCGFFFGSLKIISSAISHSLSVSFSAPIVLTVVLTVISNFQSFLSYSLISIILYVWKTEKRN